MEEKIEEPKVEHIEHKTETPTKKDPFSTFGKIAAVIIVVAVLLGGGYYLGTNKSKDVDQSMTKGTPTPTVEAMEKDSTIPSPTSTDKMSSETKTLTAGGASGTSFGVYAIDIPSGWVEKKEKTDITDKLTLTKGEYSMSIYQAPMGGGGCLYPGDPDSEMAQNFKNYVEIQGAHDKLRRSWNDEGGNTINYTVCQMGQDAFGSPTSFGAISIKTPNPSDSNLLKEIDFMLSSLAKK